MQDVRQVIVKHAGTVNAGTVFLFEKKGRIVFEKKDGCGVDEVLDQAIEAGATDVSEDEEGRVVVDTETGDLNAVVQKLGQEGLGLGGVESADIIYDPKEDLMVDVEEGSVEAAKLEKTLELVREVQGVQEVYVNAR